MLKTSFNEKVILNYFAIVSRLHSEDLPPLFPLFLS